MIRCHIGLGSNLADPASQLRRALDGLARLPDSRLVDCSPFYGSKPVGPADQPDFINAVAALDTDLPPLTLLDALQRLEQDAGRERLRHWGERTLDLDLLLYGEQTIEHPRLTVPHPRMLERAFVLVPLAALTPALTLPDGSTLASHRQQCDDAGVWYHEAAPDVGHDDIRQQ